MHQRRDGFSLLEITIVLSIVAMLAATLLAANSLKRSSQMQAVMSEYQLYAAAIKNFRTKYHALPGDFAGAQALWGSATACPVGGTVTGTQTCNGDGDGFIEFDAVPNYEHLGAWRHLGLSGFISQNFTGNTFGSGTCNIDIKPGQTSPASKLEGAVWNVGVNRSGTTYTTSNAGSAGDLDDMYFPLSAATDMPSVHALWLGGALQDDSGQAASCSHSQIPVFTGSEAFEVDMKFDDAQATSGKIRSQYNNTAAYQTCENASSPKGGYRTDATGMNCALVFLFEQ